MTVQERTGKGQVSDLLPLLPAPPVPRRLFEGAGDIATLIASYEPCLAMSPISTAALFDVHDLKNVCTKSRHPRRSFRAPLRILRSIRLAPRRPPAQRLADEINPDVLGYIFEKYINQKQMGAYYTKEDITEYISKNTIIPCLFDAAEGKCAVAFEPGSAVWRLLRDDPDRYIYPAVRHGVIDENGRVISLPDDVAEGLSDVAKRGGWNRLAVVPYNLATETWREHINRRDRCLKIRQKMVAGEIQSVNDLITFNLDLRQFAEDAISTTEGPDLLRAFYYAIAGRVPKKPTESFTPGVMARSNESATYVWFSIRLAFRRRNSERKCLARVLDRSTSSSASLW